LALALALLSDRTINTMGSFDQSKAYAAQEEEGAFFDDGREIELLHFVYSHADIGKIRGSPERVLAAIDEYGRTKKYLMNVGEDKGRIVTDLIAEVKPKTMVCTSQRFDSSSDQLPRSSLVATLATLAFSSETQSAKQAGTATSAWSVILRSPLSSCLWSIWQASPTLSR
jgi:hypothetical protein